MEKPWLTISKTWRSSRTYAAVFTKFVKYLNFAACQILTGRLPNVATFGENAAAHVMVPGRSAQLICRSSQLIRSCLFVADMDTLKFDTAARLIRDRDASRCVIRIYGGRDTIHGEYNIYCQNLEMPGRLLRNRPGTKQRGSQ